jgi:erythronate-4-phosphate dehydrogenase
MRIVVDDKIPFIRGVLDSFADVAYIPGAEIAPEDVAEADALIVRTRTRCAEELLDGSKVRFIATATIGYDHIDAAYCAERGIEWTSAPGCNSSSVRQYIASLILNLDSFDPRGKTIGVVGYGNVGSKIAELAGGFGMDVLLNDPPLDERGCKNRFVVEHGGFQSLERLGDESDLITFHVPMAKTGPYPTFHMVDGGFLRGLRGTALLVNTSRGAVVDNAALESALSAGELAGASLDVWENEPDISYSLMDDADFATPHIAGYSADGKANGTTMSVRALARFFDLPLDAWKPEIPPPENPIVEIANRGMEPFEILRAAVNASYDIHRDDDALRADPASFENLRGDYPLRREFHAYTIVLEHPDAETAESLERLGFSVSSSG